MGHLLGYARVSTVDQQPALQVDALQAAGCYRVFTETASGAHTDRPVLEQVLDQLRPGDTLVVWKLDRLGRSLRWTNGSVRRWRLLRSGFVTRGDQETLRRDEWNQPSGRLVDCHADYRRGYHSGVRRNGTGDPILTMNLALTAVRTGISASGARPWIAK
jgi:hypothetical protein